MIQVKAIHRRNSDGSYSFLLRYKDAEGKDVRKTFCRTEPKCGVRSLANWQREAAHGAFELQRQLQGNILPRKQVKWRNIEQGMDEYLAWCQTKGPSGRPNSARGTIANKSRHIGAFLLFFRAKGAADRPGKRPLRFMHHIWPYYIAHWRDSLIAKGLAATTINTMLASLAAWFKWAVDHGYNYNNPARDILRIKAGNDRAVLPIRAPEDLAELLGNFENLQPKVAVMLLAHTGLRQGEARLLRWDDVRDDTVEVAAGETETTKLHQRTIPLTSAVVEALAMLKDSRGEHPGTFVLCAADGQALTSQLNKWLKPHDVKPHDLRRFFITAMETIGAPASVIDDLVGHSPGKVRAAYTPAENLEASRPWVRRFEKWLDKQ